MAHKPDVPLDDQPDKAIERRRRALQGPVEDYRGRGSERDEFPSDADIDRFSGVTVPCPECGTVLHDDVGVCWNCGHDVELQPRGKGMFGGRAGRWVAAGVAALVALAILVMILR